MKKLKELEQSSWSFKMVIGYYAPNMRKYYEEYRGWQEPRKTKKLTFTKKGEQKKLKQNL